MIQLQTIDTEKISDCISFLTHLKMKTTKQKQNVLKINLKKILSTRGNLRDQL